MEAAPSAEPIVGRLVGSFRVERLIGSGAMGEVFLLRHVQLPNTLAALKVLKESVAGTASMKERFVQEALVAAAIGTHRVVRPLDVGRFADGRPYIVLEYVPGQTLAQRLVDRGPLPVDQSLRFVYRVADTIAVAHARGIVHRDLKPSNVMVVDDSDDPPIKVLDFGVARAPAELRLAETVDSAIIGSPGYMSPEAATGQPIDPKSDVFSLGATLFRMLTGGVPFPTTDLGGLQALLSAPSPTVASKRPAALDPVPEPVEALVARMLAKEPGGRPTMAELRDEIGAMIGADDAPSIAIVAIAPAPLQNAPAADPIDGLGSTITRGGAPLAADQLGALKKQLEQIAEERIAAPVVVAKSRRPWIVAILLLVASGVGVAVWAGTRSGTTTVASSAPRLLTHTRLTFEPAENQIYSSAVSPDGTSLAIADTHGVHVRDVSSDKRRQIEVTGKPQNLSWMPDSTALVITSASADGSLHLLLVSLGGGAPVQLGLGDQAAVSPSGSHVAFVRDGNLWTVETTGSNARLLRAGQPGRQISTPVWSSDERHLAHFEAQTLVTIDRAGALVATVATDKSLGGLGAMPLLWLADRRLVYASYDRDAGSTLWEIKIDDDGAPVGIAETVGRFPERSVDQLAVSSTGKVSALLVETGGDVHVGDLGPDTSTLGELRRITHSDVVEWPAGFTPDGKSVLAWEHRAGRSVLVRHPIDGGRGSEVSLGPVVDWQVVATDQTGSKALYWKVEGAMAQLVIAPLDGSPSSPAPVAAIAVAAQPRIACPSAPDRSCVLAEVSGRELVFSRFDLVRGKTGTPIARVPMDLSQGGPKHWEISPRGDLLAIPQSPKLQLVSVDDGSSRTIVYEGVGLQHAAFTPDGTAIVGTWFGDSSNSTYGLFRGSLDGKHRVLFTSQSQWLGYPKLSADGRRLAVLVRTFDTDVWMVEGL